MFRIVLRAALLIPVAAFLVFPDAALAQRNLTVAPTQANEPRTALIIGNAAYKESPLRNPVNDATDVAAVLRDLGFSVTLRTNADMRQMRAAIREFAQNLKRGGVGLFYFAGHGVQSRNGRNYLIPVRAEIKEEFELDDEAVDANRVLAGMEEAGNRVNIVILDACRDNPFGRSWRSATNGLAQMSAPNGSFVGFATAPGSVAADGSGRNGIYTKHLVENLKQGDPDIDRVFTRVTAAVAKESGNKQVPWKSSSLTGDFHFRPPAGGAPEATTTPALSFSAQAAPAPGTFELAFWDSIKASSNRADFEAYLKRYPEGQFADLAKNRLQAGLAVTPPPVPVPAPSAPATPPSAPATPPSAPAAAVPSALSGSLSEGQENTHVLSLIAGIRYIVRGTCDSDCTDLDLFLNEAGSNREVAKDSAINATPSLTYVPSQPGSYRLRVKMVKCKSAPCSYSVTSSQVAIAPVPADALPAALQGSLAKGAIQAHPITLRQDVTYSIRGTCDANCRDLDLYLLNASGAELAADSSTDPTPVLVFTPAISGEYTLRSRMYECAAALCGYTVRFSGDAPISAAVRVPTATVPPGLQGSLAKGADNTHTITLAQGARYSIRGTCDSDCKDLDLYLLDASGAELAKDTAPDATPIVVFTPPRSGEYRLRVRMHECTAAPCAYTVRITGDASGSAAAVVPPRLQGSLAKGADNTHTITLTQGARYSIRGTCDSDCKDLDLFVLDASGTELAKDAASDPTPVVAFTPPRSGEYTLRVRMYNCTAAPCAYSVTFTQ